MSSLNASGDAAQLSAEVSVLGVVVTDQSARQHSGLSLAEQHLGETRRK